MRTWKHFEHNVLSDLRQRGARSLDELADDPPKVLFLPMARDELAAVLDFARRRGFVEPLGHAHRPDGHEPRDEWTLTNDGRQAIRPALSWLAGGLSRLRVVVVTLASLVGAFGLKDVIFGTKSVDPFLLVMALDAIFIGAVIAISVRGKTTGVTALNTVARDWSRLGNERPEWRRKALQKFPWLWAVLGVVAFFAATFLTFEVLPEDHWLETTGLVMIPIMLPMAPSAVKLFAWITRWAEIANDAEKRESSGGGADGG